MENISPFNSILSQEKYFDEPVIMPNLYLFEEIVKSAKQKKIKIIFDGRDGDSTVSHGFERIYELFKSLNWFLMIYEVYRYSSFNKLSFTKTMKFFVRQI